MIRALGLSLILYRVFERRRVIGPRMHVDERLKVSLVDTRAVRLR